MSASRLFAWLQYLLPKYALTALIYRLARVRQPAVKDWLITRFVELYDVDTDEVKHAVPDDFATFNDFFIRELRDGEREIDADTDIVSPCDGRISQCGNIHAGKLIQAKGIDYSLADLFAVDLDSARHFEHGQFATIYLAPFNYHRVHSPVDGELRALHYVPGDLFSVNASTAAHVPGLFRRNERLNMHIDTAQGPVFLSMVGALNVGSISTPWTGEIRPKAAGIVENLPLTGADTTLGRGDLLGWFNMGSTVIIVANGLDWRDGIEPGHSVKLGEGLADQSVS